MSTFSTPGAMSTAGRRGTSTASPTAATPSSASASHLPRAGTKAALTTHLVIIGEVVQVLPLEQVKPEEPEPEPKPKPTSG
ncbi:hypothetical protein SAPIO_CDS3540 [Scedosporium apiospermum]|uniref:Uncharacterized protein n=1 Tax=Pseudallescheria apiosperma TaxID=563466 RepID=A0A084GB08_PSEDA|nr:uncharacterized protein SAPIO_CDS3540 [Scedosporium apiospermum]KEZ44520.1 hypothetical protein SAPIO_CDS3540 [Scedosporium apiospermum]